MGQETAAPIRPSRPLRDRIVLRVVDPSEAVGFVIPTPAGMRVRGSGGADYACGGCGLVLAVGIRPGTFRSFLFACGCGALNEV